jgi:hypothetical protein
MSAPTPFPLIRFCAVRLFLLSFLITTLLCGCATPVYVLGEVAMVGVEATKAPGLKSKSRFSVGQRYKISEPTALKAFSKNRYFLAPFRPAPAPDAYELYVRDPADFPDVLGATDQPFHVRITKIARSFAGDGWDLVFYAIVEDGPFAGKTVNLFLFCSTDQMGPNEHKLTLVAPDSPP